MTTYHIYTLCDPRNNEHFYVGKTYGLTERLNAHICKAKASPDTPTSFRIQEILNYGLNPTIEVLEEIVVNDQNWDTRVFIDNIERYWI